ncbi:hypothetical protein HY732_04490 [Candidatus Uhrbacteria bacterium]|nr:hypothetical protein [Candidatus Uhrbacteria bacterium]
MTLLITRPQHDLTTRYISSWAIEAIRHAERKGHAVIDLQKEKANRKEFVGRIEKVKPHIVFLNGHGSSDCVTGHDNEVLVGTGVNHEVLHGRITYALSCASGKFLGSKIGQDNQSAYIGFNDDFIFAANMKYSTRPLEDTVARPFMESSNQVVNSLLKGHTVDEATERSRDMYRKHYARLSSSIANPDAIQAAQLLWWNMRNLIWSGNGKMGIS